MEEKMEKKAFTIVTLVYWGVDLVGEFIGGQFVPNLDTLNAPIWYQRRVDEFIKCVEKQK